MRLCYREISPTPSDIEIATNNPLFTTQTSQIIKFLPKISMKSIIRCAIKCKEPKRIPICQGNMNQNSITALNDLKN